MGSDRPAQLFIAYSSFLLARIKDFDSNFYQFRIQYPVMIDSDSRERFLAAHKLFLDETTTLEKFESARTLIQGINPKVDKALDACSKAIQKIENLRKSEVIELAAWNLPERTEEE